MLAGVILGLFLLTGTRSSLLLLIGPLAMAALAGRARIRSSLRSLGSHGVVAVSVVLAFQLALSLPVLLGLGQTQEPGSSGPTQTFGPNVLDDRIGSIPTVVSNPASDASIKERIAQYEAAWALFVSSPIVGVGPGHSIDWIDVSGYPATGFTADTPLVMPAKFGLLGLLVFLGAAVAYGSTVRTAWRRNRRSGITLTLVGFGVTTIVGLPLGFPIEDKGASLALLLLLALAFAEEAAPDSMDSQPSGTARRHRETAPEPRVSAHDGRTATMVSLFPNRPTMRFATRQPSTAMGSNHRRLRNEVNRPGTWW
jgi:O-antigen ligase